MDALSVSSMGSKQEVPKQRGPAPLTPVERQAQRSTPEAQKQRRLPNPCPPKKMQHDYREEAKVDGLSGREDLKFGRGGDRFIMGALCKCEQVFSLQICVILR